MPKIYTPVFFLPFYIALLLSANIYAQNKGTTAQINLKKGDSLFALKKYDGARKKYTIALAADKSCSECKQKIKSCDQQTVDALKQVLSLKYTWGYGGKQSQLRYIKAAGALGDYYRDTEHNLDSALIYYKKVTVLTIGTDAALEDDPDVYDAYKKVIIEVFNICWKTKSDIITKPQATELLLNLQLTNDETAYYARLIFGTTDKSVVLQDEDSLTNLDSLVIIFTSLQNTNSISERCGRLLTAFCNNTLSTFNFSVSGIIVGRPTAFLQEYSWERVNAVQKFMIEKVGVSGSRIIFSYDNLLGQLNYYKGVPCMFTVTVKRTTQTEGLGMVPMPPLQQIRTNTMHRNP